MGTLAVRRPNASFGLMGGPSSDRLHLIEELRSVVDRHQQRRSGAESWSLAFSPDNSYFAWSCGHRTVALVPWHAYKNRSKDGNLAETDADGNSSSSNEAFPVVINCGDIVWSLAFGLSKNDHAYGECRQSRRHYYNFSPPTGETHVLAVGLNSGHIKIFTTYGRLITELIDHRDVVRDLKFSPDGSLILLSASRDSTAKLWDLKDDGNMFKTMKHSDNEWVMCCSWSPDSKWAATGGTGKEVYVWRAHLWKLHRKLSGHLNNVASCQFSPDGGLLASSSYDTSIILWDYERGQIISVIWHMMPPPRLIFASGYNEHFVRRISFSPDGEHLASVCDDGYVRIWNIYCNTKPICATEIQNPLCVSHSSDGQYLAVGTRQGTAHLFAPPVFVRSLARMCRSVIRSQFGVEGVERLSIPNTLKYFLLYNDLMSISKPTMPAGYVYRRY